MNSTPKPSSERNLALIYRQFGDPPRVLTLENTALLPRDPGMLRVKMQFAPVNASDLIPITGAYRHRVTPPLVAGYEGVGTVTEAPEAFMHLIGKRVLPLRAAGTWQQYVDCDAPLAVPVPDDIDSRLAARAYINPLAALLMLRRWSVRGKRVLITAGGSACALLLAQWAKLAGASAVIAIHRAPVHAARLQALGIAALQQAQRDEIRIAAMQSDVVFDAVGGDSGQLIWQSLPAEAQFVAYGVLSGKPVLVNASRPALHWFHVRHALERIAHQDWQQLFVELWPLLRHADAGEVEIFALERWRDALVNYHQSGRQVKPVLQLDCTS